MSQGSARPSENSGNGVDGFTSAPGVECSWGLQNAERRQQRGRGCGGGLWSVDSILLMVLSDVMFDMLGAKSPFWHCQFSSVHEVLVLLFGCQ